MQLAALFSDRLDLGESVFWGNKKVAQLKGMLCAGQTLCRVLRAFVSDGSVGEVLLAFGKDRDVDWWQKKLERMQHAAACGMQHEESGSRRVHPRDEEIHPI